MLTLEERYNSALATPSDIFEHLPTFVALVEELDATKVIELGTRTGVSTVAWLYALHGRGHLWSVDLDPKPDIGDYPHWSFVQGDDLAPDIYGNLPGDVDICPSTPHTTIRRRWRNFPCTGGSSAPAACCYSTTPNSHTLRTCAAAPTRYAAPWMTGARWKGSSGPMTPSATGSAKSVFHEPDWFGPASQDALARVAYRVAGLKGRVVEVGSWEGCSTVALARSCFPAMVHAVDTWEGSPGEISAELAGQRDVFGQFVANIKALTSGNVTAHRQDWRNYFALDASPVRLCFIDAEHSYREVHDNIKTVLPMMVPGGIVCGDDAHYPPILKAIADTLGSVSFDATLWIWEKEAA